MELKERILVFTFDKRESILLCALESFVDSEYLYYSLDFTDLNRYDCVKDEFLNDGNIDMVIKAFSVYKKKIDQKFQLATKDEFNLLVNKIKKCVSHKNDKVAFDIKAVNREFVNFFDKEADKDEYY